MYKDMQKIGSNNRIFHLQDKKIRGQNKSTNVSLFLKQTEKSALVSGRGKYIAFKVPDIAY